MTLLYNHKQDSIDVNQYNYHEHQAQKQDWNVARWLRTRGIDIAALEGHDQIADVITLINIRDQLWNRMNLSEQATWGAYWNIVYKHRYPLSRKFWKKFERITKAIDHRDHLRTQQRNQIQQLRTRKNMDHNNEAKGSDLPRVTYTKREQQGCRAVFGE